MIKIGCQYRRPKFTTRDSDGSFQSLKWHLDDDEIRVQTAVLSMNAYRRRRSWLSVVAVACSVLTFLSLPFLAWGAQ